MKNNKPNSRTMRRQFGGDFKQLMNLFQEVKIMYDSELCKQPESKTLTLSVGDVKKQLSTLFIQLEKELESQAPVEQSPQPEITINFKSKP